MKTKPIVIKYPCGCKISFAKMEDEGSMMLAFNDKGELDVPYSLDEFELCQEHKNQIKPPSPTLKEE